LSTVLLGLFLAAAIQAPAPPSVMLWLWETPADLRFLDPKRAGVAFLAASFLLEGDRVRSQPRMNPLRTSPGVFLMTTFRIETSKRERPSYSNEQRRQLAEGIAKVVKITGAKAVQLDFDAPKSGRAFYLALTPEVRARVGPRVFLSVTALASWCEEGWLDGLSVDEVVPMLFRMGPSGASIRRRLWEAGRLPRRACQASVGLDPTEPDILALAKDHSRIYLFLDTRRWTPQGLELALKKLAVP
jgi:hypothetical protein